MFEQSAGALLHWYRAQKRDLPWRTDRDPYRIWISEVMLQQTTVRAVIPYYEKFLQRFPTLDTLASAEIGEVLELWSGLGYYSRARNLHKAAQALAARGGFPRTFAELIELPGFGPYTARAVSSIAFDEPVGVLDGNVIRVLCRLLDLRVQWWLPKVRATLQAHVDQLVSFGPSSELNQGLMELGATLCTPQSPACLICPVQKFCLSQRHHTVADVPLKRPRREREIWSWQPVIQVKKGHVALVPNTYAPFLKGQLIYPGVAKRLKTAPKTYDFRHSITHHDIFVKVSAETRSSAKAVQWVAENKLAQVVPLALLRKAYTFASQYLSLAIVALVLASCGSKQSKTTPSASPPPQIVKTDKTTLQVLTTVGDNNHPHFSHDGTRLLFDSRNRPNHKQSQIYELSFATLSSRRITFQDGDATDPCYLPSDDGLIYASSTDEMKEGSDPIDQLFERYKAPHNSTETKASPLPRQELYLSRLDGSLIRRLTNTPGFDGHPTAHPARMHVVFTSNRNGKTGLYQLHGEKFVESPWLMRKNPADEARFSFDGRQVAWIETDPDGKSAQILTASSEHGANPVVLGLPKGLYHSVSWSPDSKQVLFSSNLQNPVHTEIYSLDLQSQCLRRLTFDEANADSPVFRPDGQKIVYAGSRSGQMQLYLMENPTSNDCLPR